jgi:glycosyltransferase involved in cell wall biosynthesis
MNPVVSAIIPTRNRPEVLIRAVNSVLGQTYQDLEVIVVVDGPDEPTLKALHQIDDSRLRIIALSASLGGAGARNAGVESAQGVWIAFLDDDDEWFPTKIELQLAAAEQSTSGLPIIACPVIARRPQGDFIYPRRHPKPSEPLSEYLLARNSLSFGEGLLQTSGIFTKRELLEKVPFRTDLRKHQDWDWLLRATNSQDVEVKILEQPLAIWHRPKQNKSISSTLDWSHSLKWIQESRNLVSPRAYAAFVLVEVGAQAAAQGLWTEFLPLLWQAVRIGRPQPIDFFLYFGMWFIPRDTRHLYRWLRGKKTGDTQNIGSVQI